MADAGAPSSSSSSSSLRQLFVFDEICSVSAASSGSSADVRIDASASFRSATLHMIALACSNNELVILRCCQNGMWQRTPYKWCHDPMRSITCLVFSPCGRYLVCLLVSGSVEVVPVHLVTVSGHVGSSTPEETAESGEELFDENELTYIPIQVRDDCLSQPTCALWYQTRSNKPVLIYANKGGDIIFFDLCLRRLTVSLQAPQSIHNIELFTSDSVDVYLLVSGFVGSQWLIPLERDGCSLRETLGTVIPSMLKELNMKSQVFSVPFGECSSFAVMSGSGLQSGLSLARSLQLYHTASLVNPFWDVVLPDDCWKLFCVGCALFVLAADLKLYCLIFRGCTSDQSSAIRKWFTFYCGSIDLDAGFVSFASTSDGSGDSPLTALPACIVITNSTVFNVYCKCSVTDILVDMFLETKDVALLKLWSEALSVEFVSLGQRLVDVMISARKREAAFELSLQVERSKVDVVNAFLRGGADDFILNRIQRWLSANSLEATVANQLSCFALHSFLSKPPIAASELERTNSGFRKFLKCSRFADPAQAVRSLIDARLYHSAVIFVQTHRAGIQLLQCVCSLSFWPASGSFVTLLTIPDVLQLFDDDDEATASTGRRQLLAFLQRMTGFLLRLDSKMVRKIYKAYDPRIKQVRALLERAKIKAGPETINIASAVVSLYLKAAIMLNWESRDVSPIFVQLPRPPASCGVPKICVACNNYGSVFVDSLDRVHLLGQWESPLSSAGGKCHPGACRIVDYFERHGLKVYQVACGSTHALFLASTSVYSLGSNKYGQLGVAGVVGGSEADTITVHVVDQRWFKAPVRQVSCGHYHSCAVDAEGQVYTWGWNVHGQLGHGTTQTVIRPKSVSALQSSQISSPVMAVAGGLAHTVFLLASGEVYSCGSNAYGQLGLFGSSVDKKCVVPVKVDLPRRVRLVCAGSFRSLALAEPDEGGANQEQLFTWGISPQTLKFLMIVQKQVKRPPASIGGESPVGNRRSLRSCVERYARVRRVNTDDLVGRVRQLQCGLNHYALVTDLGELYTWGKNYDHQLGLGDKKERDGPCPVLSFGDRAVRAVACGPYHTVAVDDSDYLWGWGKNDTGQLGFLFNGTGVGNSDDSEDLNGDRQDVNPCLNSPTDVGRERLLTISLPNRLPKTFHLGRDQKKSVPEPVIVDDVSGVATDDLEPMEDDPSSSLLTSLLDLQGCYDPEDLLTFCAGRMTVSVRSLLLFLKGDLDASFALLAASGSSPGSRPRSLSSIFDFFSDLVLRRIKRPEVSERFFVTVCAVMSTAEASDDVQHQGQFSFDRYLREHFDEWCQVFLSTASRLATIPSFRRTFSELTIRCLQKQMERDPVCRPSVTCVLQDDLRAAVARAPSSPCGEAPELLVFACGHCMTRRSVQARLERFETETITSRRGDGGRRLAACLRALDSLFACRSPLEPVFSLLCPDCVVERVVAPIHGHAAVGHSSVAGGSGQ